jgi:hypothetical protein
LGPVVSALGQVAKTVASIVGAIPPELLSILATAGAGAYAAGKFKKGGAIASTIPVVSTAFAVGSVVGDAIADQREKLLTGVYRGLSESVKNQAREKTDAIFAASDIKTLASDMKQAWAEALIAHQDAAREAIKVAAASKTGSRAARAPLAIQFEDRTQRTAGSTFSSGLGAGAQYGEAENAFLSRPEFATEQATAALDLYLEKMQMFSEARDRFFTEKKASIVRSIFGEPEEFDLYREKMEALSTGVHIFGEAVQRGMSLWVEGTMKLKNALKLILFETLQSISQHLMAKSIEQFALAVGAAATPGGQIAAGPMFAAAAGYAAASVAVAGLAKLAKPASSGSAGSGAGAGGGSGGGAPRLRGTGAGDSDRQETINIYMGDTLADDNPRSQRNKLGRAVRAAHRELEQRRGVEYR